MKIKRILFPTEFAPHAPEIFRYALALADAFDAKVLMMHAFGMPANPKESLDFEERTRKVMDTLLAFKQAHQAKKYEHIKTEFMAEIGFPGETILEAAEDEKVDLIVMGTQGNINALERYFGNVSSAIIANATCPVLLIPPSARFNDWKRFACATRFDFQDLFVLKTLGVWSKAFHGEIICLHVLEKEEPTAAAQRKVDLLKDLFRDQAAIKFQIRTGDLKTEIEAFSTDQKADVLALMHHHKSFITRLWESSVTKGVAREIQLPLLVFNEI